MNSSASLRQSSCILGHESSLPAVHGVLNIGSVLIELRREGGRERGREGGREGGREREREREKRESKCNK